MSVQVSLLTFQKYQASSSSSYSLFPVSCMNKKPIAVTEAQGCNTFWPWPVCPSLRIQISSCTISCMLWIKPSTLRKLKVSSLFMFLPLHVNLHNFPQHKIHIFTSTQTVSPNKNPDILQLHSDLNYETFYMMEEHKLYI